MPQILRNSECSLMDLFEEIDDLNDLLSQEKNGKADFPGEELEDLHNKYSSLHETYSKEIENSKKVEKCLIKCLKFHSKLCKKYEVQQKIIKDLEKSISEKVKILEEAQRNEEKLKGVIQVYRTERTLYAGQTNAQLRKEKEILIDICCKLIRDSVKSNSISSFSNLLLRKFKKDLDNEKISILKSKSAKLKVESECDDLKPDFDSLKNEVKWEDKYSSELTKEEVKDSEENRKANNLDLELCKETLEEESHLVNKNSNEGNDGMPLAETEPSEPEVLSSLPILDEFPQSVEVSQNNERDVPTNDVEEMDSSEEDGELSEHSVTPTENLVNENVERIVQPQHLDELLASENHSETPVEKTSKSIFDVSDIGGSNEEKEKQKNCLSVESEPSVVLEFEKKSEELYFEKSKEYSNGVISKEDSAFPYEKELFKIFREMTSMRMLSPIRESSSSIVNIKKNCENENSSSSLKRHGSAEEINSKSKKLKSEEEEPKSCLLDSILSAMSIQNEEFKSKRFEDKTLRESDGSTGSSSSELGRMDTRASRRKKKVENKPEENARVPCQVARRNKDGQGEVEKLVAEEIGNFVASPMSCKEEADKNVKRCISVLKNKPEDVIAKCIVATVLENIDEAVEIFERPAPPLTKTQHRLVVLLSVLRSLEWDSEKISTKILTLITEKLFPDNFFWPDDSVEAAARFYAALCKVRNDTKTLWKFCLSAMTDMRQRCPLLVFTVLKTWPDVLHDATTLKNNILAVTVANVFLHMPKTEGLRNLNQRRKLVALKHLLMNFYQFKVEDTIEGFAKKVLEAVCREEVGSEKSMVLLCRCRDQNWTAKNVVPGLKSSLADWAEGKLGDSAAAALLSVIKHICPLLSQEESAKTKVKELAHRLCEILTSGKQSHDLEVNLIEILLLLKHYSEVRKVIREWIPKNPISESLRNEIINASAENILRELKLNRRETKNVTAKRKQWKKSKAKKKKGKKGKKNEPKSRARSTGVCHGM